MIIREKIILRKQKQKNNEDKKMTCQKNDDNGKKQLWTRCRKQMKSNAKNVLNS